MNLSRLNQQIKLGVRWRYFHTSTDHWCVWTTEPLYRGGDFAAVLVNTDGDVVHRKYFARRMDAKKQARMWYLEHDEYYIEYRIEELP